MSSADDKAVPSDSPAVSAAEQEVDVGRVAVIGGGSFGTALALVMARKGAEVRVWVRDAGQAAAVNAGRQNEKYLPEVTIPENVTFTSDVKQAVDSAEIVLLAIPTQFLRAFLEHNRSTFPVGVPIVLCAKGIEVDSLETPYEIVVAELPGKYAKYTAALAGPSFAKEIAQWQPTNVAVAAESEELALKVQCQMSSHKANFRCYTVPDVMGCEVAGAVKNVLAIASGASTGCGFGNNTRAALVCRGLSEMTSLASALGASCKSMPGLAGVGDLMLTCSSELSRNFTVGFRVARGETLEEIKASSKSVAEGVATAKSLHQLASKLGVDMPICERVYQVLYEGKTVKVALKELQERSLKSE